MMSPVFNILNNSAPVKALLGTSPLRVFPWGQAPPNSVKPYATYGVFNGNPENYLDCPADIDRLGTQIDIWASSGRSCEDCFNAIRTALEGIGHLIGFQSALRDSETQLYTARMEFDFWGEP